MSPRRTPFPPSLWWGTRIPRPGRLLGWSVLWLLCPLAFSLAPATASATAQAVTSATAANNEGGSEPQTQEFTFAVSRAGSPLGTHRVSVIRKGKETHVSVDIRLEYRLAFLTLYRYHHQAQEVWRDGRLVALTSTTDDDGKDLSVTARATEQGLEVTTGANTDAAKTVVYPANTVPTSYWSRALISDRPLLDSQSGRLLDVDRVRLADGRWRLVGDLNFEIAYDQNQRWSGLWFRLGGADFVYHDQSIAKAEVLP